MVGIIHSITTMSVDYEKLWRELYYALQFSKDKNEIILFEVMREWERLAKNGVIKDKLKKRKQTPNCE